MANPLDNPLDAAPAAAPAPSFTPPANAPFGLLTSPTPALVNFKAPNITAAQITTPEAETPLGEVRNTVGALPQSSVDVGKNIIQSLFRAASEFGVSSAQAGAGIADRLLGTDFANKANVSVPTTGLEAFLGTEPLKGYGTQIQELSDSIKNSSFAQKTGLSQHALPLAFAGIVGGNAINFDGLGGEEDVISSIARETDPAKIFTTLIKTGVDKTIAAQAANHLAEVSSPSEVKATLDTLQGLQAVHEAKSAATPISEEIQEQFPHLPAATANDIATRALKQTDKSPAAVEDFINKEVESHVPETPVASESVVKAPETEPVQTSTINTPERQELRKNIADQLYGEGAATKDKRLDIVTGGPGTRKSSMIAEALAEEHGSLLADSDQAKKLLPEYDGGHGATEVQHESALINKETLVRAAKNGDNVVFPTLGRGIESLNKLIDIFKEAGYDVHLHHADLPEDKALAGVAARQSEGGQAIPEDFVKESRLQSNQNDDILKGDERLKSYSKYSTDVERGQPPKLTEIRGTRSTRFPDQFKRLDTRGKEERPVALRGNGDVGIPRKGVSVGEGTQVSREDQELAAAAAARQPVEDKVPLPPSIGDVIANGKRIPIEKTPADALTDLSKGHDSKSWSSIVKGYMYNAGPTKRAHIFDYLATPEFVLEKIGLGRGAEMLEDAKDTYRSTLKNEFKIIGDWQSRVANQVKDGHIHTAGDTSRLIFQYLDGDERTVVPEMTDAEHAVAQEIRTHLKGWASRLKLPEDNQISHYITHIFDLGAEGKDSSVFDDPELASIMSKRPAGSVYDPFLQKRLGKQDYIQDVWRALDAYTKRASRKEAMDPALEELSNMAQNLDSVSYKYVSDLSHRINMRPTEIEQAMDSFIKQTPIGHRFTERPTAFITKKIRSLFYRGTLGLNFSSALRNLSQGANTYAKLGEKYTVIGYTKLFSRMVSRNLDELFDHGILDDELIQDKKVGVLKKGIQKFDQGLFSIFELAEKINRGAAYFGAKSQAMSRGLEEDQAIKYAKRIVRETQFAFGSVDTPVFLNDDVMKTLTQMQTYNIKQFEFLARMMKQKDFTGLIRWTGASLGFVYTLGRLFGMTPAQLIPTVGIGGAPLTSLATGITELNSSNSETHAQGVSQLQRSFWSLIPAGSQLKKTLAGAHDLARGKDVTAAGKFRFRVNPSDAAQALLYGPSALPQAQKYYDSIGAKKTSAVNPLDQ